MIMYHISYMDQSCVVLREQYLEFSDLKECMDHVGANLGDDVKQVSIEIDG